MGAQEKRGGGGRGGGGGACRRNTLKESRDQLLMQTRTLDHVLTRLGTAAPETGLRHGRLLILQGPRPPVLSSRCDGRLMTLSVPSVRVWPCHAWMNKEPDVRLAEALPNSKHWFTTSFLLLLLCCLISSGVG